MFISNSYRNFKINDKAIWKESYITSNAELYKIENENRRFDSMEIVTMTKEEHEKYALDKQLENAKEGAEAQKEGAEITAKCLTIAMRIMSGAKVPSKDEQFLREHMPELYEEAIQMRTLVKSDKEYDSVLDDEDTEHTEDSSSESENIHIEITEDEGCAEE